VAGVPVRTAPLVLLGALTGLTPLAIDAYLPALPSLARDLDASSSATQLSLTALLVGLAVGQLVAGPWSDAVGRRPPVLVGLLGFVAASVACAAAPTVELLVAARFVQGAFGAAGVVCARAVVRDCFEGPDLVRALSRLVLVMGAAPVLAPLLGAQVLRVTSWRGVFGLLAAVGLALLLTALLRMPETHPPDRRRPGGAGATARTFGGLLRDRPFTCHALASGLGFAALFAYLSGSSFVLQEHYGLSPGSYSVAFAVNALGFVVASQVGSRLVRRLGARRLLLTGGAVQVAGGGVVLVAALTGAPLPVVLPGLLLVVSSIGLISPNATALALADHAAVAGAASALVGLLSYVVAGGVAPLVGLGGSDPTGMALVITACAALGLGSAVLAGRPARSPR
jgi:MFS transporter, DHA1 family, multidrug resistance protein